MQGSRSCWNQEVSSALGRLQRCRRCDAAVCSFVEGGTLLRSFRVNRDHISQPGKFVLLDYVRIPSIP